MHNPYSPPAAAAPFVPAPTAYESRTDVSAMAIDLLGQTRPWVLILSVLTFIGSAITLLAGAGLAIAGFVGPQDQKQTFLWVGLFYLPFAFLSIYPGIKLWAFGNAIGRLVANRSLGDLEAALRQQKAYWKYVGIMCLSLIALYILGAIGAVAVAVAKSG